MSDKKNKHDKKSNEEIRKEIEELEKLIKKVREQNKKKRQKQSPNPILRINLAAVYSRNFYVNLIISFLVNFITAFLLMRIMGHLFVSDLVNDLNLMAIIFGLSLYEELYKKYLFKKHMQIVIYSVGTIFFLLNIMYFYVIDYLFYGFRWFISPFHPILFVIVFVFLRYIIKVIYKRLEYVVSRRKR
mgnify:CR=1 FL=1